MRIAILIGVSEYKNKTSELPACKQDVEAMNSILEATERYDQIVVFSGKVLAADIKAKLTQTIDSLKDSEIDEVFFYYTGHGDFRDDEFFFVLSDFTDERLRQTSLQNSEIDNWLRTLKPTLAVKVVDACHSGLTYVKEHGHLETLLKKSLDQFRYCYFLFSSTSQQYSYQDQHLSHFTRSFLQAVENASGDSIRYKDIIDFISDDFASADVQTPIFVTQATFTEPFTSRTAPVVEATRALGALFWKQLPEAPIEENVQPSMTLEEMVRKDADEYISKEEVAALLERIKKHVQEHKYSAELISVYEIQHSFENSLYSLPSAAVIGQWLDKHVDDYFVSIEETEEPYRARVSRGWFSEQTEYETRYRRKVSGFEITDHSAYHWIKIVAKPRFLNIPWFNCSLVLILSKKSLRLFYFYGEYIDKSWDDRELKNNLAWKTIEFRLADSAAILGAVTKLQDEFSHWIIDLIKQRLDSSS